MHRSRLKTSTVIHCRQNDFGKEWKVTSNFYTFLAKNTKDVGHVKGYKIVQAAQ